MFAGRLNKVKCASAILVAVCLVATLCSCVNERVFYKGRTVCTATNCYTNDWRYYRIELGMPSEPYAGVPALCIRPAGGKEFRTDGLTVLDVVAGDGLSKTQFCIPKSDSPPFDSWPANTEEYRAGSAVFVVSSNRVVQITLAHSGEFQLVGETKWHRLPCAETDIREVFGPPERIYEWFRE